jgi:creatinine amidohydrolase
MIRPYLYVRRIGEVMVAATEWRDLNRVELAGILPRAVVVVPTAATEQHGPHLATGHDAIILDEIVRQSVARVPSTVDVVVVPTLAFGSSDHHLPFGGTLSLRSETYLHVVSDLLRSMIGAGASRVMVINGHGGNHELNEIAVRDVALAQPAGRHVALVAGSWWTIAGRSLAEREEFAAVRTPGHAGQLETAMMLAFRPDLVREPRPSRQDDPSLGTMIPGARIEGEVRWADFDGYTDSPALATRELGALALDLAATSLAEALGTLARADVGTS